MILYAVDYSILTESCKFLIRTALQAISPRFLERVVLPISGHLPAMLTVRFFLGRDPYSG